MSDPFPRKFGDFVLLEKYSSGQLSEVFKAQAPQWANQTVAIKRIRKEFVNDKKYIDLLESEAATLSEVSHPNLLSVYGFYQQEDYPFLVTEFFDSINMASLNKYLYQRNRLLPNYVAAYLVSQAAQGLEHLHQMRDRQNNAVQILHTDLGPHNLLVGKNGAIKLIDFSFALSAHNLKMTGSEESWVPLTAISPERAKGEPFGASSDIFELGLVFYELLTGCTPFGDKKERALYEAIKNYHIKELLLPDSMEPFLKKIFKKCLFHLQEERYASALNFERDLTKYMDIFHSEHSRLDIENYLSKVLNPNLPTLIPTSKSASNR